MLLTLQMYTVTDGTVSEKYEKPLLKCKMTLNYKTNRYFTIEVLNSTLETN